MEISGIFGMKKGKFLMLYSQSLEALLYFAMN